MYKTVFNPVIPNTTGPIDGVKTLHIDNVTKPIEPGPELRTKRIT